MQAYANQAYEAVRRIGDEPDAEEYRRLCKQFPALLHNAGLSQAVAFHTSRGGCHLKYLNDLARMIEVTASWSEVRTASTVRYQALTNHAMQGANWLKRYAEAEEKKVTRTRTGGK